MNYRSKIISYESLEGGGHRQIKELINYPGVLMISEKKTGRTPWVISSKYKEQPFKLVAEAIAAWRKETNVHFDLYTKLADEFGTNRQIVKRLLFEFMYSSIKQNEDLLEQCRAYLRKLGLKEIKREL